MTLGRYVEVTGDRLLANFIVTKTIPADINAANPWTEHDKGLHVREKTLKKITESRADCDDLEFPEYSLLDLKVDLAWEVLSNCHFCERRCSVDRKRGEKGFCNLGAISRLSSEFLHLSEEDCLVPSHTLFFVGCTFYCIFCQNWTISQQVEKGAPVTPEGLARLVKKRRLLDKSKNVNLVGGEPTPNLHVILKMLKHLDVNIPVVWNSNMYMSTEAMRLLDGVVDIYLTDFKYGRDDCALKLSKVRGYWKIITRNHLLAKEQAELLIRHLVLPNHVECCTKHILEWIGENFGDSARINIMAQYRPEFQAHKITDINRSVTSSEMTRAYEIMREAGLSNLD
ncbi:MAG: radical SAM protein [Candidatus Hydrothermarchaeota archaeon]|jgi:putative pyruvate formate lyase activating enzyme|nr:radical SAM protein [Candidatus Hydrothermarchaeota archaeon]